MSPYVYILAICLFVIQTNGQYKGETCYKNGVKALCSFSIEDPAVPVVCCLDVISTTTRRVPVHTTQRITTATEYIPEQEDYNDQCGPILANMTAPKTGQKAWDKCVEYQQKLIFPCRRLEDSDTALHRVTRCPSRIRPAILGGKGARRNEFPHMVLLGYGGTVSSLQWKCGGSLISERFILTAGHCTAGRDIVILDEYIVPACLDVGTSSDYSRVIATGWGVTQYKGNLADCLQKVFINKFTTAECSEMFPPSRLLKQGFDVNTQICYGDKDKSKDTCQGDSGGPIQMRTQQLFCMYTVVGLTSFGDTCGDIGKPGIYTRVAAFIPWIESVVWP